MPRKAGDNERIEKQKKTIEIRKKLQKKKFLEKIKDTPVIQIAAAKTGIDRSTYYRWIEEDPQFKIDSEKALEQGTEFINDMMESILIKNAKNDKLTAVIFWLKNHSKQYNDKRYYEHEHHIRQDDVLTDERKAEIAMCMSNWSEPETGDERDEDYELTDEILGRVKSSPESEPPKETTAKKSKPKAITKKAIRKSDSEIEVKTGVAKKLKPKKLK